MNYTYLINKTEDYIEENLDKSITLFELAKNANMSEYHFHRIFKSYSNETIKQFINRIKMERSAIYLCVNKSISITEIAYRYGYSDSSSYIKSFKRHFNITPLKYRDSKK